jgi:hypothetical protein
MVTYICNLNDSEAETEEFLEPRTLRPAWATSQKRKEKYKSQIMRKRNFHFLDKCVILEGFLVYNITENCSESLVTLGELR